MLLNAFQRYINNFRGFTREIWILTIITFINRAGTMVLPFLSKYLREDLHFSYSEVGWIMVCFGCGSMIGSWLGGKLSDKIGFYKIMIFSLFTTGILLLLVEFVTSFIGLCIGMFTLMIIADMFRPAMFVSIGAYAKPENRTRALTLVRLAVNLGFSAGPALGGIIIMSMGYRGLFWVDGATCMLAILVFALLVKEKKKSPFLDKEHHNEALPQSVFKDKPFWIFQACCLVCGILFFQVFTTIPLYHGEQFHLTELQTGLLLTMNGLLIFFLEMPLVSFVERKKISKIKMVFIGCFLMAISLFLMLVKVWAGILVIMMLFMTFGEMFAFPFSNSVSLSRAPKGHEGRYMAIYTMSFSMAHILSSKMGMQIIQDFGYAANWIFMGILGIMGTFFGLWSYRLIKAENTIAN
ncbi:MFS transporter [Flavobacterium silvisoli]|uniref:MFS transporter n=1 Tax=Flavobacterium silvisoli TaxID=2529433 RepID=A0A4Q9Z415_9FLAO|nr:MFS transporter [Flavobacterium silvisoli]TBX70098.1 MFS transporter [Flavobacterium silvisoli]